MSQRKTKKRKESSLVKKPILPKRALYTLGNNISSFFSNIKTNRANKKKLNEEYSQTAVALKCVADRNDLFEAANTLRSQANRLESIAKEL